MGIGLRRGGMSLSSSKEWHDSLFHPLKGKASNKMKVFGFDVETEHVRKDFKRKNGKMVRCWQQNFVMGSVVGKNTTKVFWDKKDMQDYLLSRQFRGAYSVATNLEFDFMQLFDDRLDDFKLIYRHGLLAAIHRKEENDRKRTWTMVDSTNYLKCSVSRLGDIVGLPKLDEPKVMRRNTDGIGILARRPRTREEKDELIRYNVRDSEITYKFAELFKAFCTEHNMKMKLTIGSTGMDYWRRNFQKAPLKREKDDIVSKHFNGSMRGGMTQVFKRGTYDDRLWYYDYRSAYWGCMRDGVDGKGSYPHPSCSVHHDNPTIEHVEHYDGICRASVDAPYSYAPFLGVKKAGKLLFPYGSFDGWFTNHELRKAMDMGYEVSPHEMVYYYEMFRPFRDCVNVLGKLRKEYKDRKHPFEQMIKTLGNSGLFGKWATDYMHMEEVMSCENIIFGSDGRPYKDGKPLDVGISPEGFLAISKKEGTPMRYSFPILSSYTTMLGRVKLIDDVRTYSKYLVYDDTDSAVLTRPCLETGPNLGDWELEHVCDGGVFIRNKLYMINPKGKEAVCKAKGVGKFMKNSDDFMRCIRQGKVHMERFSKMKESSNLGIKSGSVMRLVKEFNLNDDKRDWAGRDFRLDDWQDSRPIKLRSGLLPDEVRKAYLYHENVRQERRMAFTRSDLFDSHAVGHDISDEEFLENEMFFARHDM